MTEAATGESVPLRPAPVAPPGALLRPRLLRVLAGRFHDRVVVVRGGAGFGKTTLLAQAIEQNRLEPRGDDVWHTCTAADESGVHLVDGLLAAFGLEPTGGGELRSVIDAVWAQAPTEVAILLDDLHRIAPGSAGADLVAGLVEELPSNGHLVVASRVAPPFPTARLQARGELVVVAEEDLAFDAGELEDFASALGVDTAGVATSGGWPALAALRAGTDRGVAADFIWEETLAGLPAERRELLAALVPFGTVDDELLAAVGGTGSVGELVADLPLVANVGGAVRFHDLWRDAFAEADLVAPLASVRAGARVLQRRGQFRAAFDVLLDAGDEAGIAELVDALAHLDFPEMHSDDFGYVLKQSPAAVVASAQGALLRAGMLLGIDGSAALEAFEAAALRFAEDGDGEGEALVLARKLGVHFWQSDFEAMGQVLDRLGVLAAEGVDRAQRSIELSSAYAELIGGLPEAALERVERTGLREHPDLAALAGFLVASAHLDLGRPDLALVAVGVALPRSTGRLRSGLIGIRLEAVMQQELRPEAETRAMMAELDELVRYYGVAENLALMLSAYALIDLRYGWLDEARIHLAEAESALSSSVGLRARASVAIAAAELAAADGDDATATGLVRTLVDEAGPDARLDRAVLRSLPMVFLYLPDQRDRLTGHAGPGSIWQLGLEVGQALVALREAGDLAPAVGLPWELADRIRTFTPAPLVAELAVAAHAGGADVVEVLEHLPYDIRPRLRHLGDEFPASVRKAAKRLLSTLPARPRSPVTVGVLGPIELRRGGTLVDDARWGRERVRSLLALLVDRRSLTRERAAADLWPDHDEESAANNLRVNLGHLLSVLEPDRVRGEPSWFLRVDDARLTLVASELLEIDVDVFERFVGAGRAADRAHVPAEALDQYLAAVDRYRGDYLVDAPDPAWGEFDRVRLRADFVAAAVRAGELVLAVGEADEALRLAGAAVAAEPFAERGHRLQARALAVRGERASAWRALRDAIDALAVEGLEAEPETHRLLDSLTRSPLTG